MKGFLIAICVFSLMLSLIFIGKSNLTKKTNDILEEVKVIRNLPPNTEESIYIIHSKWDAYKNILQISATHKRIEAVTDLIATLGVYARHNNQSEYEKTAERLIDALEEIKQFEKISTVNIL